MTEKTAQYGTEKKRDYYLRGIGEEEHRRWRLFCADKEISLRELIFTAVNDYVGRKRRIT